MLTINTASSDVWFSVNVIGASAPAATKLADTAGEHVADVAVTVGNCPAQVHAVQREIGLTGPTWCVHVSDLQAGYAVSGTIANTGTSVSLTVKRKDRLGSLCSGPSLRWWLRRSSRYSAARMSPP
jgi:hypothetical protein